MARTQSQRDADRILYSYSFQRLAGVTQVTGPESGAILHSRLTHTLKVAQVARRITEKLLHENPSRAVEFDLDPDAAEAASLAHDLGHPPFGHVAEKQLDKLGARWGGFNGNAQSFRIVTQIENKHIDYDGLDLSRRTLQGLLKYPWLRDTNDIKKNKSWGAYETEADYFDWVREGSSFASRHPLAEIMDWADDVTYAVHDVEDFFRAGLVPLDRLADKDTHSDRAHVLQFLADNNEHGWGVSDLEELADALFTGDLSFDRLWVGSHKDRRRLHSDMSSLLEEFLFSFDLSEEGEAIIDNEARMKVEILKSLTWFYVIRRPALMAAQRGQLAIINGLHRYLMSDLKEGHKGGYRAFPKMYRDLLLDLPDDSSDPVVQRVVTDVIAGMTEETATQLFARISGCGSGSILDATARSIS